MVEPASDPQLSILDESGQDLTPRRELLHAGPDVELGHRTHEFDIGGVARTSLLGSGVNRGLQLRESRGEIAKLHGIAGTHRIFAPLLGSVYTIALNFFEFLAVLVVLACVVFLIRRNVVKVERFTKPEMKGWPALDGNLILVIMAGMKANEGIAYRYPFALRIF